MQKTKAKENAALAAIKAVDPNIIIGVGTGSTVNYFIEKLAEISPSMKGVIPSSSETEHALSKFNIPIVDLNDLTTVDLYIDGADQINGIGEMIKGGGGALTREKIIANAARQFICIVDESKTFNVFGSFPVPIEVLDVARSYVARECVKLGGTPKLRENYITDNGHIILDVDFRKIEQPIELERSLNNISGVISNGIFAARGADIAFIGTNSGVKKVIY